MEHWNKAYAKEAYAIAASVLRQFKRNWLADRVERGLEPRSRLEIQIAMRALMVARGDIISN